MAVRLVKRDLVVGVSPFGEPSARVVASVCRAGGLGVLDLGTGDRRAREELDLARKWAPTSFGVRVRDNCLLDDRDLEDELGTTIDTVMISPNSGWHPGRVAERCRLLVEVTSLEEAVFAALVGAHGLVARGSEAGGRVGELSSFVLLQQLLSSTRIDLPIWVCGGIGLRTAVAAVAGGAAGVVLDTQLALMPELDLPEAVTSAISGMDGSETTVVGRHRVLLRRSPGGRPDTPHTANEVADLLGAQDLRTQLLPIGQDGFLATRFEERFGTVERAVRAVRAEIIHSGQIGATTAAESPLCRALGTTLPVVQGPMTRVSDQASFAETVAAEGAMPFIALALATKEQTSKLLTQTKALLKDRPWGVGVLGFAPEELRTAQLEVIRELRPSCAIIAGGRPAQARTLEEAGITAFLHVPSPGLLSQFLDAGARKFVFEGAECGGHIGPRASFPLWEAQLSVLLDYLDAHQDIDASEIQVLFAGGIHDARSAAMVTAMAAPLADHGAGFGVLMGTAYLFTEEAVRDGAVRPLFQRQVLDAERTELLETAPGHSTRCVSSPFAEGFRAIKADLHARGLPDRDVWEKLEQLNVGRLRIASKGVRREGGSLVTVDEDQQLTDGMFMAGQVAVLRSATTTVADLHASVTAGAAAFLANRAGELREWFGAPEPVSDELAPTPPLDVAIVGMACMFPQAPDLATFWSNVVDGVDAVTEVPPSRWDTGTYYATQAGARAGERTLSKWGGFLPPIPFDPLRYGIPPSSLASIEPAQLLALEAAHRALVDAGYGDRAFDRSRTAVVFGAEAGSDLSNATVLRTLLPSYLGEIPSELDGLLPTLTEDSFPGMLANVISGRITNRLDLGGANYTVDAACASSLAAVDVACKELVSGVSDLVLCGGADLHNGIHDYLLFSSVHALSPTGQCRTFDSSADGTTLGEGVACVALKRLADAERDGDRIYAVISGVGSASDGRSLGLTAPRPEGQRNALQRAYRNAGVSPADVGMVEAHGTGTVVGDRTELSTLTAVFTEAGAAQGSCALGSVKSQIGHTKCAAGLAGLIKAAMSVYTGIEPPTLHLDEPNSAWQAANSPFAFHTRARPWAVGPAGRIAGVSAFGFGGTNFHVVIKGHDAATPRHGRDNWPCELFTFRGADQQAAYRSITQLLELADAAGRPWRLRDLAKSIARRADQRDEPVQVAVVASDLDDLVGLLRRALAGEHDPANGLFRADNADPGKVALLFPGQGSQRPGMLADLFVAFPETHRFLELGPQWTDALFPPKGFGPDSASDQEARLRDTRVAQPTLGMAGLAVHHLLTRLDIRPDMLAGHSYGELVALCAAGSYDTATLLDLSEARADAILAAAGTDPGTMAAVSATADEVGAALDTAGLSGEVIIANHNAPKQVVISGPTGPVDKAVEALRAIGLGAKKIPVACAFHSPAIRGACGDFADTLARYEVRAAELPVWSNRTAAKYPEHPVEVRAELAAQIGEPVRFADQIEAMYADGARVFVEAGPGRVLSRLVDAILGDRPHVAVACEGRADSGLRGFLGAVAQLAVAGVGLRTGWLFTDRDAVDVAPAAPKRPGWTVDGQLLRTSDGAFLPNGLVPAQRVLEMTMTQPKVQQGSSNGGHELINDFLSASREIVSAQRDVLLTYLGAAATAPPVVQALEIAAPMPLPTPTPEPVTAAVPEPAQSTVDIAGTVLEVISERTGYPLDLIEPDLDLEADLSIDSIKRAEIAGELATRLGASSTALGDEELEQLAKARTAQAITSWLAERLSDGTPSPQAEPVPAAPGSAPKRFALRRIEVPAEASSGTAVFAGKHFVVFGDTWLDSELTTTLTELGASVTTANDPDVLAESVDGVIYLAPLLHSEDPVLPEAFPVIQAALRQGLRWFLTAYPAIHDTAGGHHRVAGLRGLFRTIDREYPDTNAKLVEIDPTDSPAAITSLLVNEMLSADNTPVVLTADGGRYTVRPVEDPLGPLGSVGAGPAGEGTAEALAIGLDRDSVVLLVGGARGITASFAATLAGASGCRIELIGRTALPTEPEHPLTAAAVDRPGLRAALVELGHRTPAEVDRLAGLILAQREVSGTIEELRALGSSVRYHTADIRDHGTVDRIVKEIHTEHGRLDGVVYAAGVIEDKLLADKDIESFRRVFGTKVDGACSLLEAVETLPTKPGFVVLFGSISAVFGNRGQSDYAAANDALETMGSAFAARTGNRVLTVHWGPWAPSPKHSGMVDVALQREYTRRGIELIDPEEGTLSLLRELAWGDPAVNAVVYTASGW